MKAHLIVLLLSASAHATNMPLNFFAGAEDAGVEVATSFAEGETLSYRVSREHRTLAAGTARVEAEGVARLSVAVPEMNPGVALPLELTLARADGTLAKTHKAWGFSKDPVVNPTRKIHLVDTGENMTEMLASLPVAFERVRDAEDIAALTNALVVVGGGWDNDVTWAAVLSAAERGADVLLLAPAEESVAVLPQTLRSFSMGRAQEILCDANAPYELAVPIGGLRLAVAGDRVALRVDADALAQAAQWRYGGGGRVRVCGIPLTHALPAARWLLAEMLSTGEKP